MIYLITTITDFSYNERFDWYEFDCYRTVGYTNTLESAIDCVVNNNCDMHETCYEYAIIEEIPYGFYPEVKVQKLYKFNDEKFEYEEINPPKNFFRCSSYVIG